MIEEMLQYVSSAGCCVKFSFEIPLQIVIRVSHSEFESISETQCLPWDHVYDGKVLHCVKYCTQKVTEKYKELQIPVSSLKLSTRTSNCLEVWKVNTVAELVDYTEAELLKLPQFGNTCLLEIKKKLAGMGLKLAEPNQ
jgi:DNA-directed RNA polymerase alpha subunit